MQCRCLFFLSLTLFVGLSYAQSPALVMELSATTVTFGGQLTASCTATSTTASRVLYINGESVTGRIPGDRLSTSSEGMTTTWTIDPVQREDAGEYYCFAGGEQAAHSDSPPQNVTVYFPPDATIVVPAAKVLSGGSAKVVIFVEAIPEVTGVQFVLPRAQAKDPSHSAVGVTSGNVTLTFPSVNRYYNGTYTANFTNGIGSATVDFELTVYFGPYFSHEGEVQVDGASIDVTYARGQDVILVCEISATNPAVSSLILTKPNADNVEFDEGTGTISITGATAANEGTYTCTADNGVTTPTTISFVLRMDMSSIQNAGNVLEGLAVVTAVMLLVTLLLS